jgi:phytoene dehydrogenase-like protein
LEQDKDLDFRRIHYQIRAFGVDLPLSLPFDRMQDRLVQIFPEDTSAIQRFFQDVENIISAMTQPEKQDNRTLLAETGQSAAAGHLATTVKDWRLRRFLGSLGTHEPYSSVALMAAMWNLMGNQGIWYPVGGMALFCQRLVQAVVKRKDNQSPLGEIRTGVEVKAIRVQGGKVVGVTLSDGTDVAAEQIISNADFKTTFLRLLEPESLPDRWHGQVTKARQTGSVLQVCLGLDKDKVDLSAFSEASRLLYRRTGQGPDRNGKSVDWMAKHIDPEALADQELEMALLSKEDPTLAPENGHVLAIRTEADHTHFSQYRSPTQRRVPTYKPYKLDLAKALIKEAAGVVPGLEEAIQIVDVATPLTFEDQGGRSQGAVAGWSWDYEDAMDYEPVELIRTPVAGLFMAGYQAYSNLFMGGVPTAMVSGQKAAEHLLKRTRPTAELSIPGSAS